MLRKLLLVLFLLLLPCHAYSAGFDCSKAASNAEIMICNNSELSALDEQLARIYKAALASTSDKTSLRAKQREWIKHREKISDVEKMQKFYQDRFQELQSTTDNVKVASESSGEPSVKNAPITAAETTKEVQSQKETSSNPAHIPIKSTATQPTSNATTNKESSLSGSALLVTIFVILIAVVTTYAIGIKMQESGAINIFVDYTDALLTVLALLVPLVMSFIIMFMSEQKNTQTTAIILTAISTIALLFFPIKSAFIYNRTLGMSFLALLIKVLTSVLYAFGIAFIFGSGIGNTGKRSDETESEYRRRAAANRTTSIMLVLHHMFIAFIVHKTTRCSGFTGETLNFAFGNRYEQLMATAAEE